MSENARSYGGPPHGSMAEEAVKLVEVAQLWLASQSSSSRGADDVWAEATAEDHTSAECRGCPICRVRRVLADVSPEVYEHLAEAVAAVGAAIRALDTSRRPDGRP
jgi:hypothetical protein